MSTTQQQHITPSMFAFQGDLRQLHEVQQRAINQVQAAAMIQADALQGCDALPQSLIDGLPNWVTTAYNQITQGSTRAAGGL